MVFSIAAAGISLLATVLFVGINTLLLWLLSNYLLNWQDKSVQTAFKTAFSAGIIGYILNLAASPLSGNTAIIIGIILFILNIGILLYLLKKFYYHTNLIEPLKGWICLFIADIILGVIVGILLGMSGLITL